MPKPPTTPSSPLFGVTVPFDETWQDDHRSIIYFTTDRGRRDHVIKTLKGQLAATYSIPDVGAAWQVRVPIAQMPALKRFIAPFVAPPERQGAPAPP